MWPNSSKSGCSANLKTFHLNWQLLCLRKNYLVEAFQTCENGISKRFSRNFFDCMASQLLYASGRSKCQYFHHHFCHCGLRLLLGAFDVKFHLFVDRIDFFHWKILNSLAESAEISFWVYRCVPMQDVWLLQYQQFTGNIYLSSERSLTFPRWY